MNLCTIGIRLRDFYGFLKRSLILRENNVVGVKTLACSKRYMVDMVQRAGVFSQLCVLTPEFLHVYYVIIWLGAVRAKRSVGGIFAT